MSLAQNKSDYYTYADYCAWPDDQPYELIDGVAYAMSPAPTRIHQRFTLEIARQIADALEGGSCEVNIAPFDVRLPEADEEDEIVATVVQPDITIVCDREKLDEKGCRGAPDWVIEIASPSTAAHDRIRKLSVYQVHGVREYWIVQPFDRIASIYLLKGGEYGKPDEVELKGKTEATILAVVLDWDRVMRNID